MGYTHYWRGGVPKENWERCARDIVRVIEASPVPLADGHGTPGTTPYVSKIDIVFNGVGEDSHETMVVERGGTRFNFCKTRRKPYDVVVVACLCIAAKHGLREVESDGGADDWAEGLALAQTVDPDVEIPGEVRE